MAATNHSIPASGAGSVFAMVQESTFGVTPTTPSFNEVRSLPVQLSPQSEEFVSEEVNALRVETNARQTSQSGSLNLPMELSYGVADDLLAAALLGDWNTEPSTVEYGDIEKTYAVELFRSDAATPYYVRGNGVLFNRWSMEVVADGARAVSMNFDALVASLSVNATSQDVDGFGSASTNEALIAADGAIELDSANFAAVGLNLSYEDPRQPIMNIGSKTAAAFAPNGNRTLTGQITMYADSKDHLDRYFAEANHALSTTLTDPAGNVLKVDLPTIRFGAPTEDTGSGSIRVTAPFRALAPSGGSPITITRTPV